jgi:hypothetical protein
VAADAFGIGDEADVASTDWDIKAADVAMNVGYCGDVMHVELKDGNFITGKGGKKNAVV